MVPKKTAATLLVGLLVLSIGGVLLSHNRTAPFLQTPTAPVNTNKRISYQQQPYLTNIDSVSSRNTSSQPSMLQRKENQKGQDTKNGVVPSSLSHIGSNDFCRSECRLCDMQLDNSDQFVDQADIAYLRRHVLFGVVTGNFENFFRVDLSLCTWLVHVPPENLYVFTNNANESDGRVGTWVEGMLPAGVTFSRRQMEAKGYDINWIKAQYRFIQGMQHLARLAQQHERDRNSEIGGQLVMGSHSHKDSFGSSGDVRNSGGIYRKAEVAASGNNGGGPASSSSNDGIAVRGDELHVEGSSSASGSVGPLEHLQWQEKKGKDVLWIIILDDDTVIDIKALVKMLRSYDKGDAKKEPGGKAKFLPRYIGDHGWGGAGHFLNYAAAMRFLAGSHRCVEEFMVKKFFASDVTLKKCMPVLGIRSNWDKRVSHCHANFLRERMLTESHVSAHVKREMVKPRALAMWRVRMYYQVTYHHNKTAFNLLMKYGSCAYGSCKNGKCSKQHDRDSLAFFWRVSNNGTSVPLI